MDKKVTVIGAGAVGATTAMRIAEKGLADVVLVDIVEGLAEGKALDIMESAPVEGFAAEVTGTCDHTVSSDSDMIIVTAGVARKPGMSRDDLQSINAGIVSETVRKTARLSPRAIVLVVTNPLDVMSYLAWRVSGFDAGRVIGMAGVLDAARFAYFVSRELGIYAREVNAMVLGGHGDSMVPLPRHSSVGGVPLTEMLPEDRIRKICARTRKAGGEIVKLLKTGSAYYSPSSSVVAMAKAILRGEGRIMPCSVLLSGEYGLKDVYCGVPVKLSACGVERIVELDLTGEEKEALASSAAEVRESIEKLDGMCG